MKIYNGFGIKPTNTHISAGTDFYIPNIKTCDQFNTAIEAFKKSYKVNDSEINAMFDAFKSIYYNNEKLLKQTINIVHLFLALGNCELDQLKKDNICEACLMFAEQYLVYDEANDVVGVRMQLNDTLFINSGIKVALDTVLSDQVGPNVENQVNLLRMLGIGIAGLYVNKSGKGNAGYDIRACLVDEDYAGYVHLSVSYTKETNSNKTATVYCGDKLTQMMLIPVFHTEYVEVSEDTYNGIMENSERKDDGFGSSDKKH